LLRRERAIVGDLGPPAEAMGPARGIVDRVLEAIVMDGAVDRGSPE